jgi:hypothetical protein
MQDLRTWGFALVCAGLLCACAAGLNNQVGTPNAEGTVAGFWLGLWHGAIAPITFVLSLFKPGIAIYEVHNSQPRQKSTSAVSALVAHAVREHPAAARERLEIPPPGSRSNVFVGYITNFPRTRAREGLSVGAAGRRGSTRRTARAPSEPRNTANHVEYQQFRDPGFHEERPFDRAT